MDYTVHGILQARILEWIAFPFSRRSSQPRGRTQVSFIAGNEDSLPAEQQGKSPTKALNPSSLDNIPLSIPSVQFSSVQFSSVAQSCSTLCNPMHYTVHGIFKARILEWVAFPFSRRSSQPRDRTQVSHIAGGFFTV